MTAWASFYPWVLPHVPGCPSPMVDQALRDAAREFCRRSRVWQEQAAAVEGDGTTQQFALVLPTGSELVRIERATVAGEDMEILSSRDMPADWTEDEPDTAILDDTLVVLASNAGYVLYPVPADGDEIVIYQSLMPTMSATAVGDLVFGEHGEDIAQGALARLYRLPKQSWTDLLGAEAANARFQAAIHLAGNRTGRQARLRVKPSPI